MSKSWREAVSSGMAVWMSDLAIELSHGLAGRQRIISRILMQFLNAASTILAA